MSITASLDERNRETVRGACGVRINDGWASKSTHSFRRWLDDATVLTWCDLAVNVRTDGAMTTLTISCQACGEQSWRAIRDWKPAR